jgi:hypothetical protein
VHRAPRYAQRLRTGAHRAPSTRRRNRRKNVFSRQRPADGEHTRSAAPFQGGKKLIELELIKRLPDPTGDIIASWDLDGIASRRRAAIIVENIVLAAMKAWLAKVGWTSSRAPTIRHEDAPLPMYGQFTWDLVGPCYLAGVITYRGGVLKNGFIAGDILLDRPVRLEDLIPFFNKWDCLRAQRRPTRFQPIFIAESFAPDALEALRKRGCFVAIPSTIFGEEIGRQLGQLIDIIGNAAAAVVKDPDGVFKLIDRMSKLEGASLNLRGVVVELIIAHLYKLRAYNIDIRQRIKSKNGDPAEIDVKATNRQEVVCIECKGKSASGLVGYEEVEKWLYETLPRIKSWLKLADSLPTNRRFEFYSSTDYTPEAADLIARTTPLHKSEPIRFYKGSDIVEGLHQQNERALIEIFKEQFVT